MKSLVFNITATYIVLFFLSLLIPVIAFRHLLLAGVMIGFVNFCLLPIVIKLGLPRDYLSLFLTGAGLNLLLLTVALGLISNFTSFNLMAAGVGGFALSLVTPLMTPHELTSA